MVAMGRGRIYESLMDLCLAIRIDHLGETCRIARCGVYEGGDEFASTRVAEARDVASERLHESVNTPIYGRRHPHLQLVDRFQSRDQCG